jgi:hypothetical protein
LDWQIQTIPVGSVNPTGAAFVQRNYLYLCMFRTKKYPENTINAIDNF